jgi:transglutaminase-like putative cysteine protease
MRKLLCILSLALTVVTAFAAAVLPPPTAAELSKITARAYPDADAVLVLDQHTVVYQADGRSVETDDYYYKILTEKGRRAQREQSFPFNTIYSKLSVDAAEIIRPDGTVLPVDVAANSKIVIDPTQMGSNIFDPHNKIYRLAIPALQIGDTLRLLVRNETIKPRIPDVWCDIFSLQSADPVIQYIVTVDAPAERPLAAKVLKDEVPGTVKFSETAAGGRIVYRWEASDVPQVFAEPNMPPLYMCTQRLLLSTAPDWQAISKWYYALCRPRLDAVTPEMKTKVAELTAKAAAPIDQVNALFQFVSQNIRYMGITPEEEAPGYEPHDVSLTFNNRYGVCRDKAALLVAMLEIAGVKAYPVLFMVGPKKDFEAANNHFNHAIVAAELVPGEYTLMDPTVETAAELLHPGLANQSYLVAKPEGETLKTSPIIPAEKNMLSVEIDGKLAEDGRFDGRAKLQFGGVNDNVFRDAFSRWPKEYRRQFFAAGLKQAVPGAELDELEITPADVRDMEQPLAVKLTFHAPFHFAPDGQPFPLELPFIGEYFGIAAQVLESTGLKTRKFPMQVFSTCGVAERLTIDLPPGLEVAALPKTDAPVDSAAFSFSRKLDFSGGKLTAEQNFAVKLPEISPAEYAELKRAQQEVETLKRAFPLLRNAAAPAGNFPNADAVYRKIDRKTKLSGPTAWESTEQVELQILNYAGVKRFSELKIEFNPVWETVELESAEITSPDGRTNRISPKEVNIMDAAWAGAAPRYPAGKVLVANLPGVKPGAVIRYTLKRTYRDRPFFADVRVFADYQPVLEQRYTLETPPKINLEIAPTPPEITRTGDTWERRDIPAVPHEFGGAPLFMTEPAIFISGGKVKEYAAAVRTALIAAAADQPKAAAKARELTAAVADDPARLLAIRDFVEKSIREAGPAFNALPLGSLTPADRTLADGYGNSADRAILLKAMLDAVNLPARFVAVSPFADTPESRKLLTGYPENAYGEIVLAAGPPDAPVWLNSGSEYAIPGSANCENRLALDLDSGRVAPVEPAKPTIDDDLEYLIRAGADGTADITVTRHLHGNEFESERRRFTEYTPEERRRAFEEMVSGIAHNAEAVTPLTDDFSVYPGVLRFTVKVPGFVAAAGKFREILVPGFGLLAGNVATADSRRRTPFFRRGKAVSRLRCRIELPEKWTPVALPPERRVANPLETLTVGCRADGRAVEVDASIEVRPGLISSADYGRLVAMQSMLRALPQRMLIAETK